MNSEIKAEAASFVKTGTNQKASSFATDVDYRKAISEGHGESYAFLYSAARKRYNYKDEDERDLLARQEAEQQSIDDYDIDIFRDAKYAALHVFRSDAYANAYAFVRSRGIGIEQAEKYAHFRDKQENGIHHFVTFSEEHRRQIRSAHDWTSNTFRAIERIKFPTSQSGVQITPNGILLFWDGEINEGKRNVFCVEYDEAFGVEGLSRDILLTGVPVGNDVAVRFCEADDEGRIGRRDYGDGTAGVRSFLENEGFLERQASKQGGVKL
jgi:hypothetical protein